MTTNNAELLEKIISNIQKKNNKESANNTILTKPAVVIKSNSSDGKTTVYFLDDETQTGHQLYNKCGQSLFSGDNVKVFYTTNPLKGWIGCKSGVSRIVTTGVGKFSEWDETSEYFNYYDERENVANETGGNIAGDISSPMPMYSHAEGFNNKAIGFGQHAEGLNNTIKSPISQDDYENNSATVTINVAGGGNHIEGGENQIVDGIIYNVRHMVLNYS